MSRRTLTIGIAACLLGGVADLGLVNLYLAPAAFAPAAGRGPSAAGAQPSGQPTARPQDDGAAVSVALDDPGARPPAPAAAAPPDETRAPPAAAAPPAPPGVPDEALARVVVLFDTASHALRPEARPLLARVAANLRRYPRLRVRVTGHTDQRGEERFNTHLSDQRNRTVVFYLRARGVAVKRIDAQAFGASRPAAGGDTPEALQRNRRVEVEPVRGSP